MALFTALFIFSKETPARCLLAHVQMLSQWGKHLTGGQYSESSSVFNITILLTSQITISKIELQIQADHIVL